MEPATSEISNNPGKSSPSASVLLVDDEALIRWALSERFSQAGYEVREAGDGTSALAYFREGEPRIDLVVLDVQLPDANGIDLLKQIQRLCPSCRVILMTAFGTTDILQDARDNGAYDLLRKPFDIDHMFDTVQRALSQ
jgi:DNA-binding NtrC family response regulator